MLLQAVLLLSLGSDGGYPLAGRPDDTPQIAKAALGWAEAQPEQVFDVFQGEERVAWTSVQASLQVQGEATFLELVTLRRTPADAKLALREVVWLRLDSTLSPERVMLFEATERATQVARLGVVDGKLTGKVHGRAIVRNVPLPIGPESALLLRAALLALEGEGRERVSCLRFGRRSAEVDVDQTLAFSGFKGDEPDRLGEVIRRGSRGQAKAVYRFDGAGGLVSLEILGRDGERWVRRPLPEDD